MRHLIIVIAVIGCFGLLSSSAQACTCGGSGGPCENFGSAAAVFVGTVISARDRERKTEDDAGFPRAYKFFVDQSYRGIDGMEAEIATGYGSSDCGYEFRIGGRYLVYAYRYKSTLVTTICSRTKAFTDANEDLAFLGNLSSAAPGATIHGGITRFKRMKTEVASIASDALVIIENEKVRREVKLNAEGRYSASGLPSGTFKVTLQLPEKFFVDRPEREIPVGDRGCGSIDYWVFDNGRMSGRVVDASGQPIPKIWISVYDPDADPIKDFEKIDRTDDQGKFSFKPLPAGRYLISVNHQRYRDPQDPTLAYPSVFYPGVIDRPNAELISLGTGENLEGVEVRVPLRRSSSALAGQVVWDDGTPVSKAQLILADPASGFASASAMQTDEQGRFKLDGFAGQRLVIMARSDRPYVASGKKDEPMERTLPVSITLEKPQETVKIVITKLR